MSGRLNRTGYESLIAGDLEALRLLYHRFIEVERRLELEHIELVLEASIEHEYGAEEADTTATVTSFLRPTSAKELSWITGLDCKPSGRPGQYTARIEPNPVRG